MNTAVGLIVIAFAVLMQAAVMPAFSIFGVQPNLVLAVLVAWIVVRPAREAFVLIPAAGLLLGLLDGQPLGLAMLALAPLILMTAAREIRIIESDLLPAVILMTTATLVYESTVLLVLAVTGENPDWPASALDVLVPAVIANILLLLPVYGLIRLASLDLQRRRPAF